MSNVLYRHSGHKIALLKLQLRFHFGLGSVVMEEIHTTVMIVGLGNHPMPKTRHSVGMMAADHLVQQTPGAVWQRDRRLQAFVSHCSLHPTLTAIVVKPTLLMNVSGRSVAKAVEKYGIPTSHILLVQDDLEKPVGRYRIKANGSAGGHNGVKSVVAALGTDTIPRLKIGVDRPNSRSSDVIADYVLQKFTSQEAKIINDNMDMCLQAGLVYLAQCLGISKEIVVKNEKDNDVLENQTEKRTDTPSGRRQRKSSEGGH